MVNQKKSMIMELNVDEDLKRRLKAEWKQKGIQYFGMKFSDNVQDLVNDNVHSLYE